MSVSGDRAIAGKPKPINKQDYEFYMYCGGMGGGDCFMPIGTDRFTWYVENDPEAVVNRYLSLFDTGRFSVHEDDGPAFFPSCRFAGPPVPIYVAVSVDGNITPARIMAQNMITGFGVPAVLEFDEKWLPQPTDPRYHGRTYVTVYWGNPLHVSVGFVGLPYNTEANLSNVET